MAPLPKIVKTFHNKKLLEQAFTHRSFLNEKKSSSSSNERLEFLGDSIISFLVSEFLYKKFPKITEGELTNIRTFLIKTETLAKAAREQELGHHLLFSKGEEEAGGRNNPSLLANTFEAFVGALYLDGDIKSVRAYLNKTLFAKIEESLPDDALKDNKSRLQELVQAGKKPTPNYRVLETRGPDHKKIFTVGVFVHNKLIGKGTGRSKQEAEQQAAKAALEKVTKISVE